MTLISLKLNAQNAPATFEQQVSDPTVSFEELMQTYKQKLFQELGQDSPRVEKKFQRAISYHEGRTSTNFAVGQNRFLASAQAFKNASDNRSSICSDRNPHFNGSWELLGPLNLNAQQYGLVLDIWVNPTNSNEILVATFGGVFKTSNANDPNGSDWINITDGANNIIPAGYVAQSFAVNPTNFNEIFVGTAIFTGTDFYINSPGGTGLIKSTDGGITWQIESSLNSVVGNNDFSVSNVRYNQNGTIIYAFTSNGFFAKAGTGSWQQLSTSIRGRDIEPRPNHPNEAWLSEGGQAGMKTFHCTFNTSSQTFTLTDITQGFSSNAIPGTAPTSTATTMGAPWHFEISAQDENTLWAMTNRVESPRLPSRCSTEWGGTYCGWPGDECVLWKYDVPSATWSFICRSADKKIPSFFYGGYNFEKVKNEPNRMYIGREVLYCSTDGGLTFPQISTYYTNPSTQSNHADVRSILIYNTGTNTNGSQDVIYFGTDGGLGIKPAGLTPNSINSTKDFTGNGIPCSQFYGLATSEFGGMHIGGTMHDGGLAYEPSKTPKWLCDPNLGDAYGAVFGSTKPRIGFIKSGLSGYRVQGSLSNAQRTIANFSGSNYNSSSYDGTRQTYITPFFSDKRGNIYWPQARLWRRPASGGAFLDITNALGQFIPNFNGLDVSPTVNNSTNIHRIAVDFDNDDPSNQNYDILHGYISYTWGSDANAKKLFRRKSNSTENPKWQLVTQPAFDSHKITAIAMHNEEHNRVWVSLGDVTNGVTTTPRVVYSANWGDSWIDMSNGLPREIPVNTIVQQKGTNILYAGTDIGVFMLNYDEANPSQSFWTCFNDGAINKPDLPSCPLMGLSINYCSGKLVMASHGRGIWESDLFIPNNEPAYSEKVVTNTTWSGEKFIESSVVVKTGTTLTINGTTANPTTIYMPKFASIIVEKGAKLVIDNATITNGCGAMWNGIGVQGEETNSQQSFSGSYFLQGVCEIKNGAIIENSINGVANYFNYKHGGIILASNSTFKNNRRSLEFLKYQNFHPVNQAPMHDKSTFTNCTFVVDDNMSSQEVFSYFVTAWAVHGVQFYGCDFKNLQTNSNPREKAFFSIDASYIIKARCITNQWPCNSFDKNTFDNLDAGVDALGYNGFSYIEVDQSEFLKNQYGVRLKNCHFPIITRNKLNVGEILNPDLISPTSQDFNITYPSGIILDEGSYFRVEENEINGTSPFGKQNLASGIWIQNLPYDNLVYKNKLENVSFANVAYGTNMVKGMSGTFRGLKYKCNLQNNNNADIVVHAEIWNGTIGFGIHPFQGMSLSPAANTFSHSTFYPNADISNNAINAIDYYHRNLVAEKPLYYNSPLVLLNSTNDNPSCLSNFNDGKIKTLEASEVPLTTVKFQQAETEFNTYAYLYANLIDGGNTSSIVSNITSTWSDNMLALRNLLLSRSPNLSQSALEELALNEEVPQAMLMEILLLNSQSTKSLGFIDFLENRIPNPLPNELTDLIKDSWSEDSYRKNLESKYAESQSVREQLRYDLILSALRNPDGAGMNEIATKLIACESLQCKFDLADYYEGISDFEAAASVLNNLPTSFELRQEEEAERQAAIALISFKQNLLASNTTINNLSEADKNTLRIFIANHSNTKSAARAENAMCFFYGECNSSNSGGNLNSGSKSSRSDKLSKSKTFVYPNPVDKYITIKFTTFNASKIIIHDAVGRKLDEIEITNNSGLQMINTSQYPNGVCNYSIISLDNKKVSGTFLVQHP